MLFDEISVVDEDDRDTLGEDANESGWFWLDFVVVVLVPFLLVVVVLVDLT